MQARDEAEAAEADMPPALSAFYLGFLLDAIPGDVHAHLAQQKGATDSLVIVLPADRTQWTDVDRRRLLDVLASSSPISIQRRHQDPSSPTEGPTT
jgi:hypothetical protein